MLAAADVALVASGTVTVQAALHECPMVVVYRLSPLTYRLGRPFVRVDTFAMANLVAGRRVVPELIQDDFTPEAVAEQAMTILDDPVARDAMRAELRAVRAHWSARRQRAGGTGRARVVVTAASWPIVSEIETSFEDSVSSGAEDSQVATATLSLVIKLAR